MRRWKGINMNILEEVNKKIYLYCFQVICLLFGETICHSKITIQYPIFSLKLIFLGVETPMGTCTLMTNCDTFLFLTSVVVY